MSVSRMHLLEHFAFAATAGTFVEDDDFVLVRRDDKGVGALAFKSGVEAKAA